MYNDSVAILFERFPRLGLIAATLPEKNVPEESISLKNIDAAEVLYIYGLSTGLSYFQCKDWLRKNPDKRLVFLEDDPGIIGSFLHLPQAVEILSDPQVHLELFHRKKSEIVELARNFPAQKIEFIALPSKKGGRALHLKISRQTALFYSLKIDRLYGYMLFENFIKNARHISYSFYVNRLKGAFKNVPAVICGAGPSLGKTIEELRTLENKALIFAGGSTLAALSSQGIMPHFAMAVDPNEEEYFRLRNSFAFEVPFLYSTRVHPGVFQTCNGPFGYMRSGIGGVTEFWLENELGFFDPLIGDNLSSESMSVTALCIATAQFFGCNPILLNGIDMAYTDNKRYANGVVEGNGSVSDEKGAGDQILKRKNRLGRPVYTAVRWVMESASISHFAKKYKDARFVNTTEEGLGFKGIEYVPLNVAAASFEERDLRTKIYEAIELVQIPENTKNTIETKISELQKSLAKVIDCLEILAEEKKGSAALAEFELKEEIAFSVLFYDIYQTLRMDDQFWKKWLFLALKYRKAFQ